MVMRIYSLTAALLLLSACSGSLEQLRSRAPAGEDFQNVLASEYLAYANAQAEQGNTSGADYFAAKGLKAASGEVVEPEALSDLGATDADSPDQQALTAARASLIDVLTPEVKKGAPSKAARAQIVFDCWVQQLRSGAGRSALCADGFALALEDVQLAADQHRRGKTERYVLDFVDGSAELPEGASQLAQDIAASIKGAAKARVELHPYYSSQVHGSKALAQKRSRSMRDTLAKAGVSRALITQHYPRAAGNTVYLSSDEEPQAADQLEILVTLSSAKGK
jgi:OmpA-OmpF porin, OOP family